MNHIDLSTVSVAQLASLVYETLQRHKIDAVLVGGACVAIYSHNRYQSSDLDFVTYEELKPVEQALVELGFKRTGRCFSHSSCPYLLDFVNPPVAVGHEPIRQFEVLELPFGTLKLLTPTDCVKDRLAAFFYWNDQQGLEQALLVAEDYPIHLADIQRWAEAEGYGSKLKVFLQKISPPT